MLKRNYFLLLLIFVFGGLLMSCSNDDDALQNNELVGTWEHVESYSWGGYKNEVGTSYTFTNRGQALCRIWTIKDNKTTKDEQYTFKYTFDGRTLTLKDSHGDNASYRVIIKDDAVVIDGVTYTKKQ